ncbi:hypothetical protein WEI85_28860 [Actinomycetes bacterium KLBMP 9797]
MVVAAHVKRRSEATYTERLDLNNIAAACLIGCDILFELGYIHVDFNGQIQRTIEDMQDLDEPAKLLNGRLCAAFNAKSRRYFAEHARRAVTGRPEAPLSRLDLSWPKHPWDTDLKHPS